MTFIATAPVPSAAKQAQIGNLVRNTQFSVSYGGRMSGRRVVTLCFNGPRGFADQSVVAEFKRIAG